MGEAPSPKLSVILATAPKRTKFHLQIFTGKFNLKFYFLLKSAGLFLTASL